MPAKGIDLLNLFIGFDLLWGALGNNGAMVQHRHLVGNIEGHIDIMLDDDHRNLGLQAHDQLGHEPPLASGEPGHGFVQQQDPGFVGQGDAQFQLAVFPVGEFFDRNVEFVIQTNPAGDLGDMAPLVLKFAPGTKQRGDREKFSFHAFATTPETGSPRPSIVKKGWRPDRFGPAARQSVFARAASGQVPAEQQDPASVQGDFTGGQVE